MKKLLYVLLAAMLMVAFTGCKEDTVEPQQDELNLLTQYLKTNNLDLSTLTGSFVTSASKINVNTVDYSVPDYYVMDLRSAGDFANGHIKNAVNVPIANVLDEAKKAGSKPILVVCYTGQTAARAVAGLQLMGYNAKILKWGMAGWHDAFAAKWSGKVTDVTSPNWVVGEPSPAAQNFALPVLNTGETDPAKILEARVKIMLLNTAWMVQRDEVLANPGNYFVVNFWPQVSWDAFGHIKNANRIMENLNIANLKNLDASKPCLVYCYTGQTSGVVTGWLEVLGYNAKSLGFGANGISWSQLKGSDIDGAKGKSWRGDGSGSNNNFGYYDNAGNLYGPLQ